MLLLLLQTSQLSPGAQTTYSARSVACPPLFPPPPDKLTLQTLGDNVSPGARDDTPPEIERPDHGPLLVLQEASALLRVLIRGHIDIHDAIPNLHACHAFGFLRCLRHAAGRTVRPPTGDSRDTPDNAACMYALVVGRTTRASWLLFDAPCPERSKLQTAFSDLGEFHPKSVHVYLL